MFSQKSARTSVTSLPMGLNASGDAPSYGPTQQAVGPYLHAVRRRWLLVLVVTLLAAGAAAFTVHRITKQYSTSASILVTPLPEGDTLGIGTVVDDGDPARTVQTAATLIDSPEAAALAARTLGRPWTPSSVFKAVTVTPRGASDVIAVTATAPTPIAAERLADTFAHGAITYRAKVVQQQVASLISGLQARLDLLNTSPSSSAQVAPLAATLAQLKDIQASGRDPTMSVTATAQLPNTPNGAASWLVVLLALAGGFAVASVAALGLETFSVQVRDREELNTLYPLPVLAAIPEVRALRADAGIPPWDLPADAFEQLRMLRVQLSLAAGDGVIMVTSAQAADGKTTVCAGLAAAFAEADHEVILIDFDVRKPGLQGLLGVEMTDHGDRESRSRFLEGAVVDVPRLPGVRLMLAPRGDKASAELMLKRLPKLLAKARLAADIVIVDTAPVGEVSETLSLAPSCDQVVFVARPRRTDRRRLTLARDLLERVGAPPVGLVLVGKETGLPRGSYTYSYSVGPRSPDGLPSTDNGSAAVPPVQADASADLGIE